MKQYKRLTMPSLVKENTLARDGLFSKAYSSSQEVVEDQITLDLPAIPCENPWTYQNTSREFIENQITLDPSLMPYEENSYGNQIDAFLTIPFTPRPTQSNGHNGHNGHNGYASSNQLVAFPTIPSTPQLTRQNGAMYNGGNVAAFQPITTPFVPDPQIDAIINAVIEKETSRAAWESEVVSNTQSKSNATSKWAFFLELPHLLVYMLGALAIAGLYLIIPLLNLLNATIPGSLNTVFIALGIIAFGELLVCVILARTIPGRKVKKGKAIAHP